MLPLLASSFDATPYLIALVGSTGVAGAVLALLKLRGEKDSLAVTQAQGAMGTMQMLTEALEDSLDRANKRGDYYKRLYEETVKELETVNRRWGPFPNGEET